MSTRGARRGEQVQGWTFSAGGPGAGGFEAVGRRDATLDPHPDAAGAGGQARALFVCQPAGGGVGVED